LMARHPIKPTSRRCPSAWQPNPGRRSTYRRGDSVQTTGTTSVQPRQLFPWTRLTSVCWFAVIPDLPLAHLEPIVNRIAIRAAWQGAQRSFASEQLPAVDVGAKR
jgi:hypothetical protein